MAETLEQFNKQAIAGAKPYMGNVAWPTVAFTLMVILAFVINLSSFASGLLPVWAAILLMGVLTYFSYTPLHEAAHGNVNGKNESLQWLNDLCGFLVAPLIGLPYASHKLEHFAHHRYTNQPDKDPDFPINNMRKGLRAVLPVSAWFLWTQNTFFIKHHWAAATLTERAIYCAELLVSVGWRIGFVLLAPQPAYISIFFLLTGYFLGGFFTAYWFAYRPHLPYENTKRYQTTNSLILPAVLKPFEWFWLGQNLHSIHHLFPRVPFYQYHAVHKKIEPALRAHGTPIIGMFDRKLIELYE